MTGQQSILLIGPTGSGKSPLGDHFELQGFGGRKCFHFDFGAQLRQIDAGEIKPPNLTDQDLRIIGDSIKTGALLEDRHIHIAREILSSFMERNGVSPRDILVLNGLPRHSGQVRDLKELVDTKMVISLECPADVVRKRIQLNLGGDRAGRGDDSLKEVERRSEDLLRTDLPAD